MDSIYSVPFCQQGAEATKMCMPDGPLIPFKLHIVAKFGGELKVQSDDRSTH